MDRVGAANLGGAEVEEIQVIGVSAYEIILWNDAIILKPATLIDPTSAEVIVISVPRFF